MSPNSLGYWNFRNAVSKAALPGIAQNDDRGDGRRFRQLSMAICVIVGTSVGYDAPAGVIRHDRFDLQYQLFAEDDNFATVGVMEVVPAGNAEPCSCTLIAPRHVLTAAHCLTSATSASVTIGGTTVDVNRWTSHPNFNGDPLNGSDIAVVTLDEPIEGLRPATRLSLGLGNEIGFTAIPVGFGRSGNGNTGDVLSSGTKRAGQNVIDAVGPLPIITPTNTVMLVDFDNLNDVRDSTFGPLLPTHLEILPAPGDSGGPWFVQSGSLYRVAGVTSYIDPIRDGVLDHDYGELAGATRVALFNAWINERMEGVNWNRTDVGLFSVGDSWGAGRVPGFAEDVRFSIPHDNIVLFTQNVVSRNVTVEFGDTTFSMDGFVYVISQNLAIRRGAGSAGSLTLDDGGVAVAGSLFVGNLLSPGKLTIEEDAAADVAGLLSVFSSAELQVNGGELSAGLLFVAGDLALSSGDSLASTDGDYSQHDLGRLSLELASESRYDQLSIGGHAALAGELTVSLAGEFSPTAGQSFDLIDWATRSGTFSTLTFPNLAAGLSWDTTDLYATGVLSVISAVLDGDYDQNGIVDAADYVVWRKNDGTQQGYNTWRINFGASFGVGKGTALPPAGAPSATVPEPATQVLLILATAGWCLRQGHTTQKVRQTAWKRRSTETREAPTVRSCGSQLELREEQARSCGVADRLVVLKKPGNAGGGKEPDFWRVPGRDQQSGDWLLPINSIED